MLLGFKLGTELVLHPRFDPAAAVKDIVEKKITIYMGVPTMHVAILSVPGLEKMDFSSLRLCGSGGARCRSPCRNGSKALSAAN